MTSPHTTEGTQQPASTPVKDNASIPLGLTPPTPCLTTLAMSEMTTLTPGMTATSTTGHRSETLNCSSVTAPVAPSLLPSVATRPLHTTPKKSHRPVPYAYPNMPHTTHTSSSMPKINPELPPFPPNRYPVTPLRELEPQLVCPGAPRKEKKSSHLKMVRSPRRRRRLLLE